MKFSALLAGAVAVLGFSVVTAQAAPVGLQLTLVVDPVAQTWQAFGQITGDTTQTLGLAGIKFDVDGAGGITVNDTTTNDMPIGTFLDLSNPSKPVVFQSGFFFQNTPGSFGLGIQGGQNNSVQTSTDAHFPAGIDNIVRGVGLVAGTDNNATFADPLSADGTYSGTIGTLTVTALVGSTDFLPATLPAGTTSGAGFTTFSPDFITPEIVIIGALVPEPASLSLLGLGAVALIARRRKAKA